jgi:hypothetical protein
MTNCRRPRKPLTILGENLHEVLGDKLMSPEFGRVVEDEIEEEALLSSREALKKCLGG